MLDQDATTGDVLLIQSSSEQNEDREIYWLGGQPELPGTLISDTAPPFFYGSWPGQSQLGEQYNKDYYDYLLSAHSRDSWDNDPASSTHRLRISTDHPSKTGWHDNQKQAYTKKVIGQTTLWIVRYFSWDGTSYAGPYEVPEISATRAPDVDYYMGRLHVASLIPVASFHYASCAMPCTATSNWTRRVPQDVAILPYPKLSNGPEDGRFYYFVRLCNDYPTCSDVGTNLLWAWKLSE